MTVRTLCTLAAAVVLASFTYAETPMPTEASAGAAEADNQKLADAVAAQLRKSGVAKGAKFSVMTENGTVILAGRVCSDKQAENIVKEVKTVAGVGNVDTELQVAINEPIQKVAADELGLPAMPSLTTSHHPAVAPPIVGSEPLPLSSPAQPAYDQNGPKLPPYAWPTYAPFNNYSRVGYPQAYPYNAFPFIGPFYPFPKVPLGWRSVKLEWDDGHWYIGRLSTPHDYWRVKFW